MTNRPPRLALCGNVFPGEDLDALLSTLAGPVTQWARAVGSSGERPGFGLYLAASLAVELVESAEKRARLRSALEQAGVSVWTANAFPYGGFHGARVKELAFQPGWDSLARFEFTLNVARLLCEFGDSEGPLSVSTCPIGYGADSASNPAARANVQRASDALAALEQETGKRVVLAFEPEPDGGFERVPALCTWLAELAPGSPHLGVCWDLCHSAVVGESTVDVLTALENSRVPLGKVQVSSALRWLPASGGDARPMLDDLAGDPYFHQVRGQRSDGQSFATPDLRPFLEGGLDDVSEARIHCHVPIHRDQYGSGLAATPWRAAVAAALTHGIRDFEIETYTLPVLPPDFLEDAGLVGTMAAEWAAAHAATRLVQAG